MKGLSAEDIGTQLMSLDLLYHLSKRSSSRGACQAETKEKLGQLEHHRSNSPSEEKNGWSKQLEPLSTTRGSMWVHFTATMSSRPLGRVPVDSTAIGLDL